jgi:hypothetical protein
MTSLHSQIQSEVLAACKHLEYQTAEEHRGAGWRADILAVKGSKEVAFEVQLSGQSLRRTLERQLRYSREGVVCCWLFQRSIPKLLEERPDLPLFCVSGGSDNAFRVSLSDRKEMPLHAFVEGFLEGRIRFCTVAWTRSDQPVRLIFYEMKCWKCQAINHVYYVDATLRAACNALIRPEESLWESNRMEYHPEIVGAARRYLTTDLGSNLRLGEVKPRYSRTVDASYTSFGCYRCDSIFGDWFVADAEMEARYGFGQVAVLEETIRLEHPVELPIPHWCYPESGDFCDGSPHG